MEFRVGRSQKPFTVEVKRGRKGAPSPQPAVAPKPLKTREPAAAVIERQPVAPPSPPRRILDAIEPPPAPVAAAELQSANSNPDKPRRGRPPKSATAVAPRKPGRPRRDPARETRIFVEKAAVIAASAEAPIVAPPALAPVHREAKTTSKHGHVSHIARAEAATSLPRGERWKRRVPKVLW
jgi:hypothetical protein